MNGQWHPALHRIPSYLRWKCNQRPSEPCLFDPSEGVLKGISKANTTPAVTTTATITDTQADSSIVLTLSPHGAESNNNGVLKHINSAQNSDPFNTMAAAGEPTVYNTTNTTTKTTSAEMGTKTVGSQKLVQPQNLQPLVQPTVIIIPPTTVPPVVQDGKQEDAWRKFFIDMQQDLKNSISTSTEVLRQEFKSGIEQVATTTAALKSDLQTTDRAVADNAKEISQLKVDLEVCKQQMQEMASFVVKQDQKWKESNKYSNRKEMRLIGVKEIKGVSAAQAEQDFLQNKTENRKRFKG